MKKLKMKKNEGEAKPKYNNQKVIFHIATEMLQKVSSEELKRFKETEFDERHHIIFDSQDEARYYRDELLPMVKERSIIVEFQPKYTLIPKFEKEGVKHQAVTYTPDFKVTYFSGKVLLIDVKGVVDQKFPIKRKLFDHLYPELPPLVVLKYCKKFGGWLTIEDYTKKKREENKAKKAQKP